MKILFWGNNTNGYRQKAFIDYATKHNYEMNFSFTKNKVNKYLNTFYQLVCEIKTFPKLFKVDIIYLPPMEHTVLKVMLAKFAKKKVICDIYAPIYDMTVNDEKIYSPKSLMAKRYLLRDRLSMKLSNIVIFLNNAEKKHFIQSVGLKQNNIKSISVPLVIGEKKAANLKFFKEEREEIFLCWTGSYIALQGLDCIIDAMDVLRSKKFVGKLYIIGPSGEKEEYYKNKVKEKDLGNYIEFKMLWGNLKEWEEFIANNCDISLGIFGNSEKAKCVVANKVIDGIASKTPVITGKSKGIDIYFNQVHDIYTVNNNPYDLADKIIEVKNKSYEEVKKNIDNAYVIYKQFFSETAYKYGMDSVFSILEGDK